MFSTNAPISQYTELASAVPLEDRIRVPDLPDHQVQQGHIQINAEEIDSVGAENYLWIRS